MPPKALPAGTQATVKIVNIGQGDCILITTPNGRQVLVDGGSVRGMAKSDKAAMERLKRDLWGDSLASRKPIDILVLTHNDDDHYNKMGDILGKIEVKKVYYSGKDSDYSAYVFRQWKFGTGDFRNTPANIKSWESITVDEDAPDPITILTEQTVNKQTFKLEVLAANYIPPDTNWTLTTSTSIPINTRSIVIRGSLNGGTFLLMGDATHLTEEFLIENHGGDLKATIMKVGHHGGDNASTEEFVTSTSPKEAVFSCYPPGSRFKHPQSWAVERWAEVVDDDEDQHDVRLWNAGEFETDSYTKALWVTFDNGTVTYTFEETGMYYRGPLEVQNDGMDIEEGGTDEEDDD